MLLHLTLPLTLTFLLLNENYSYVTVRRVYQLQISDMGFVICVEQNVEVANCYVAVFKQSPIKRDLPPVPH